MYINNIPSTRISGLATGLDTDQLVKDLMKIEKSPLDRLFQKKQLAEWKRDEYRDITNLLRGIKDEFMNVLKPASNMLSQSNYNKYLTSSTNTSVVTAQADGDVAVGTHTISIKRLATADKAASTGNVTKALEAIPTGDYALSGKSINIELDGTVRKIELDDYNDLDDFISKEDTGLQALVDKAFGVGKILVSNIDGKLNFNTAAGATKITLTAGVANDGLESLGFSSGSSNRISTSDTLETLADKLSTGLNFNNENKLVFSINNKEFSFDKTVSLGSMMNTINSDKDANANMIYDEATDKLIITAKNTGAGDNIIISQTGGNFFDGASKISSANPVQEGDQGVDAEVYLDGQYLVRSSNEFTVNGISYTINKIHSNPAEDVESISITRDTEGVFNNIKAFVEKYNEVIETINGKLGEKYDRSYQPLTDEQKEGMTDEEVEKWEKVAKTGLLKNDSLLTNIVYDLRRALFDKIEGSGITLSSIGINTGSYSEKGKLKIDETKLKDAISKNPDGVMNLFSQKSTSQPSYTRDLTSTEKKERYNEQGIVQRFYDIIEDNISTLRDKDGRKGILLEKAGITHDLSEFNNILYKQIEEYDKSILRLQDKLYAREEYYYNKFTAMEKAIAQMNAQSNWLYSQFQAGG